MRLVEIQLEGFGRLVDRSFHFAPGFNLIFGPNEAGKSTLQQAVLAMLYGFYGRGSVSAALRRAMRGLQPWDGSAYAGSLTFAMDDGQAYQILRHFGTRPTARLLSHPQGQDVSSHYETGSHGRLYFADQQLGLSKEVFEHVCFVRQAELMALDRSAGAIADSLMRLLASAETDTTVTEAIGLLDAALKEHVGTDRSWTKPWAKANARLEQLNQERARLHESRRECFAQLVELHKAEQQMAEFEAQRQQLQYLQTVADYEACRDQLDKAQNAADDTARLNGEVARWQAWADFPAHLRDDVLRLSAQRDRLIQEGPPEQERAATARTKLRSLEERMQALQAEAVSLEDARSVRVAELPQVQAQAHTWQLACEAVERSMARLEDTRGIFEQGEARLAKVREGLEAALELGPAGLTNFSLRLQNAQQRIAQSLEAMKRAEAEWAGTGMTEAAFAQLESTVNAIQAGMQVAPKPRRGCLRQFGPSVAPTEPATELVIYSQVKPLHQQLVATRDERAASDNALRSVETEIKSKLGALAEPLTPSSVDQLAKRLERQQGIAAEVAHQQRAVDQCQSELGSASRKRDTAEEELRVALAELGHGVGDIEECLEAFHGQCARRERLSRVEAEREHLQARLQAHQDDIRAWEEHRKALDEIEAQLLGLVSQASLPDGDQTLEQALEEFEEGAANHGLWLKAQAALEAATKHQMALGADRARLQETVDDMEERLAATRSEHPAWRTLEPDKTAGEYADESYEVESRLDRARDEVTRLRGVMQSWSGLRHPAELDDEIALVKAEIGRLERLREALQIARSELEEASHELQSQFAPRLEQLLGDGLARVTQNRYSKALVDPDTLAVSLTAPELDQDVAVDLLSTGTRDLVYLLLRLSIACLMSSSEETLPLLLDDPLVQCDDSRQERALGYLAQLAEENQMLFFTKNSSTRSWFEENLGESERHRLHVLA